MDVVFIFEDETHVEHGLLGFDGVAVDGRTEIVGLRENLLHEKKE